MDPDRKKSIVATLVCHALVLFGISAPGTAIPPAKAKVYLEVTLADGPPSSEPPSAPANKAAAPAAQQAKPDKVEKSKKLAVKEPEPVIEKPKPDAMILPKPVSNPKAISDTVATKNPAKTVGTAASSTNSSATVGASDGGANSALNIGPARGNGGAYRQVEQASWDRRITPEYPALAQRRREEGTVVLTLYINEFGKLDKAEVKESSGHRILDEAALFAARWSTFNPAYVDGVPTACKAEAPYRFYINIKPPHD